MNKKVKIIATLGPASNSPEKIKQLAEEGVDVFRINLSHAAHSETADLIKRIRSIEKDLGRPLAIMGDLAGPKIRIEEVEKGVILKNGENITISVEKTLGTASKLSVNYPSIVSQLRTGALVYIDDGRIQLEVVEEDEKEAKAVVIVGGALTSNKGFYAEGISLDLNGLSDKDKKDVSLMVQEGADALAISFVQTEADIASVRELLPENSPITLIAKIETVKGIENIESIIKVSDGIMVARGDLGLAVPIAEVPHLQKKLIQQCLVAAKPVITATQMLESMHHNPIPTRAEVTDVANAILDGTDAVMLSGETAVGEFPVETVKTMVKIILKAIPHVVPRYFESEHVVSDAISGVVGEIADQVGAHCILAFTQNGVTARRISRHRHDQVILAISPLASTLRRLNFSWGVYPVLLDSPTVDFNYMREQAKKIVSGTTTVEVVTGDPYIIVAGLPFGTAGSTNMIFVERL